MCIILYICICICNVLELWMICDFQCEPGHLDMFSIVSLLQCRRDVQMPLQVGE